MKKKGIAVVVSAMILCMAAAGCGAQSQSAGGDGAASGATTAAALATTAEAAAEEDMSWQEFDDAYVTGVKAADYVALAAENAGICLVGPDTELKKCQELDEILTI